MMKWIVLAAFLLAGVVVVCGLLFLRQPEGKIASFDQFSGKPITDKDMAHRLMTKRELNAPHAGEKAPGFRLKDINTGELVSLSSLHREKPVVLLFGSVGCDVLDSGFPELRKLSEQYRDRLDFVMIYIREAHSLDWINSTKGKIHDPKTDSEREKAAQLCRRELEIPFRILVDTVDDKVATRWGGWPIRLFVIDTDGTVRYASPIGPWGFRPTDQFIHGDGKMFGADLTYNQKSLSAFLETYFRN